MDGPDEPAEPGRQRSLRGSTIAQLAAGSTHPTAFISYSHTSEEHVIWVQEFAKRLREAGVDVRADFWSLAPGADTYEFMEQTVTDPAISHVLIVCDARYRERADGREGGVGVETQILSPKVYERVTPGKFVCIVKEKDAEGRPYLPVFMAAKLFIDLADVHRAEGELQRLIKHIYGLRNQEPPPLGSPPTYVLDALGVTDEPMTSDSDVADDDGAPVRNAARTLDVVSYAREGLLRQQAIPPPDRPYDEFIVECIATLSPAYDDILGALLSGDVTSAAGDGRLAKVLEVLLEAQFTVPIGSEFRDEDWDHVRFLNREFILRLVASLLNRADYGAVDRLVNTTLFYRRNGDLPHTDIVRLDTPVRSIDRIRNARLQARRVSISADMIRSRAIDRGEDFDALWEADLLLHYLTILKRPGEPRSWWFPHTAVYNARRRIDILGRLVSRRHFDSIKVLFGASTPDELSVKLDAAKAQMPTGGYGRWDINYDFLTLVDAFPAEIAAVG